MLIKKTNLIIACIAVLFSCNVRYGENGEKNGSGIDPALPYNQDQLVSIVVVPSDQTIFKGDSLQFQAIGNYSDGTTADISSFVTWSSDNVAISTVNAGAIATGTGAGQATIQAKLGDIQGASSLKVKMHTLYLPNTGGVDISIHEIDHNTGQLSLLGAVPVGNTGEMPTTITMHPNQKYIYASYKNTNGDSFIGIFKINQNTGLLDKEGSILLTKIPRFMLVHPSGKFLYATMGGDVDSIAKINISPDGMLSAPFYYSFVGAPVFMNISPSGRVLYVSKKPVNEVDSYSIDSTTGNLTSIGSVSILNPVGIESDPIEKSVYVASSGNSGSVFRFKLQANEAIGNLVDVKNTVAGARNLLASSTKNCLYVLGNQLGKIGHHKINGMVFDDLGPQVDTGLSPTAIVGDPSGQFVYVTNYNEDTISMFKVDSTTGELTGLVPAKVLTGSKPAYSQIYTATVPAGF